MASDPLSSTTHKARTYLLALSTAGFLSSWYNLKVRDIPFSGVDITVDEKLVPIMLTVGIGYFLASFIIYAVDDLINQAEAPYLERLHGNYTSSLSALEDRVVRMLVTRLDGALPNESKAAFAAELYSIVLHSQNIDDEKFQKAIPIHIQSRLPNSGSFYDLNHAELTQRLMGALNSGRQELALIKSTNPKMASKRYQMYRQFRVWFFDVTLPPLVAISALTTMWWHLLPL